MRPFFFLSYSRKNGGPELERFFRELETAVRQYASIEGDPVGFHDTRDIDLGDRFTQTLSGALRTVKTFVAIYSPAYFESDYCGKEWAAFRSRFEAQFKGGNDEPPLVFPVLWVPMEEKDVPAPVRSVQFLQQRLGEEFARLGLYRLSEQRHEEAYRQLIVTLAETMAKAARNHDLRDHPRSFDFDKIPSGFDEGGSRAARRERTLRDGLGEYLRETIWARLNPLPLHAVSGRGAGAENLHLSAVYTPLEVEDELQVDDPRGPDAHMPARVALRVSASYRDRLVSGARDLEARVPRSRRKLAALEAAAGCRRLVLLGAPGSGKSTFARHLALSLAGQILDWNQANLEKLNLPRPDEVWRPDVVPWPHGALVPVFVELADFVQSEAFPRREAAVDALFRYLETRKNDPIRRDVLDRIREAMTSEDEALLILDGLDETPNAGEVRDRLRDVITAFTEAYPGCRVLVTSRPYAYETDCSWRLDGAGFERTKLSPLSEMAIEGFVFSWFRHLEERKLVTAEQATERAKTLMEKIRGEAYLRPLAESPLMLTMMADLVASGAGVFRGGRANLYKASTHLLLDRWNEVRHRDGVHRLSSEFGIGIEEIQKALEEVAYEAHKSRGAENAGAAPIQDVEVWKALDRHRPKEVRVLDTKTVTEHLNQRSGILLAESRERYCFPHRTFQEYLAACYLRQKSFPNLLRDELKADPNLWREVFLFAAAQVADTPFAVWGLLERIVPKLPSDEAPLDDPQFRLALYAGKAVAESSLWKDIDEADGEKLERIRTWLTRTLGRGALAPVERAEAGRTLATIGDRRKGGGLQLDGVPEIDWVEIPAGQFLMGDGRRSVELHAFRMSRYTVTNAQYESFMKENGYHKREYWSKKGWAWRQKTNRAGPENYEGFTLSNHPRVGVSWFESEAFCGWLSVKVGFEVRLPREAEWEKAARGEDGREYPWGDRFDPNLCNSLETGIGRTSAVGMFPGGKSLYGLFDMSGNVWEWCMDLYQASRSSGARVLRGGAFDSDDAALRSADRGYDPPDGAYDTRGFRVVWSAAAGQIK